MVEGQDEGSLGRRRMEARREEDRAGVEARGPYIVLT